MDLTMIRLYIKKTLTPDFVILCIAALFFGICTLIDIPQMAFPMYSYKAMVWKGYIFLFIVFACELSKGLLQMEKITKRIEWLLANGVKLSFIMVNHTIVLWVATVLLLAPLFFLTWLRMGRMSWGLTADFFTLTGIYSILINMSILSTKNMNRYKGLAGRQSITYFIIFLGEMAAGLLSGKIFCGIVVKYVYLLSVAFFMLKRLSKEKIVTAYY